MGNASRYYSGVNQKKIKRSRAASRSHSSLSDFISQKFKWLVILLFGIWIFLLSGVLPISTHSPGVIQSLQLRSLLQKRKEEAVQKEIQISALKEEKERLIRDKDYQEKVIRETLGYVGQNEIIFDF